MRSSILQVLVFGAVLTAPAFSQAAGENTTLGTRQADRARLLTVEQRLDLIEQQLKVIVQQLEDSKRPFPETGKQVHGHADNQGNGYLTREQRQGDIAKRLQAVEEKIENLSGRTYPISLLQPITGSLVVNNWTGISQNIRINGVLYSVPAGSTTISVPYSIVEAYMPSWEAPKLWGMSNWIHNGKHHFMTINIRPI